MTIYYFDLAKVLHKIKEINFNGFLDNISFVSTPSVSYF